MADRTRLSGTQAGGRAGTFCRTGLARLPPSRHPLHCGVRIPDLRARDDSPLRGSCHHALPAICLTRRLPAQRIRRCGLNATFRTRLQRCDGDWWPLSPRRSRVAHAALLATASDGRAYRGKTEVSIKDIRRDALVGALDADQTESLVEALTRSGWLRREAAKPSGPKGGKPVRRWQVNPLLWAAETAETAETSVLKSCSEISADSAVSAAT